MVHKNKHTAPKRSNKRTLFVVLIVLVAAVLAGGIWAITGRKTTKTEQPVSKATSTPQPTTAKGETTTPVEPAPVSTTDKTPATTPPTTPAPPAPTNVTLAKPFGTFVSNHKPGQNGSPLEESSVCNTTPSANCTITFTKNGISKSLPAKIADNSGAAYWPVWTPQSVGLDAGNWTVTAVATLGQQTTSTQDPNPLQVL